MDIKGNKVKVGDIVRYVRHNEMFVSSSKDLKKTLSICLNQTFIVTEIILPPEGKKEGTYTLDANEILAPKLGGHGHEIYLDWNEIELVKSP